LARARQLANRLDELDRSDELDGEGASPAEAVLWAGIPLAHRQFLQQGTLETLVQRSRERLLMLHELVIGEAGVALTGQDDRDPEAHWLLGWTLRSDDTAEATLSLLDLGAPRLNTQPPAWLPKEARTWRHDMRDNQASVVWCEACEAEALRNRVVAQLHQRGFGPYSTNGGPFGPFSTRSSLTRLGSGSDMWYRPGCHAILQVLPTLDAPLRRAGRTVAVAARRARMTTGALGRRAQAGMLIASVVAGLVAAGAAHHALTQRFNALEAAAHIPTVVRVVAMNSLQPGDRLTVDTVALRDIPVSGAVSDAVMPEEFDRYADAVVLREIKAGEQVLRTAVSVDMDQPLSARLADGRRAVTISVDDVSSQAGMLHPGDRLNILATVDLPSGRATILLLRAVPILAVGQRAARHTTAVGFHSEGHDLPDAKPDGFSTITLDVDEASAIRLVAARQASVLNVALRRDVARDASQTLAPLTHDVQRVLGFARPTPVPTPRIVPVLYVTKPAFNATVIDAEPVITPNDALGDSWP
jgi:pilus assembly protein CpaB